MYSSAIPLKYLTLEVVCKYYLYHQITVYDRFIAYSQLVFFVINVKSMINYLAARKLRHAKIHFNIMCHAIHTSGCTILHFIRPHLAFLMFSVFFLYNSAGSSYIAQVC